MQRISLPDGTILEFPDGMSDGDMANAIRRNFPEYSGGQTGTAPQPESSALSGVARGVGLGARQAIEGAGGLVDAVASPFRYVANRANEALGGAPDYFQPAAPQLADALGLPKPETPNERTIDRVGQAVFSTLPTMGAGAALQTGRAGAQIAPSMAQRAGALLAERPVLQGASAAASGLGQAAGERAGFGPGGQIAMSLAGGMVPVAAASGGVAAGRALSGGRTLIDTQTGPGRRRIAGQILNRTVADRDAALAGLQNNAAEIVPGSLPTTAQASGDRGLAVLEKGLASSGPAGAALQERYLAQGAARQAAIRQGLEAQAPYGGTMPTEGVGRVVRNAFDENYGTARQATRQAYDDIDPDGLLRFDLRPLAASFSDAIGAGRFTDVPAPVSSLMGKINAAVRSKKKNSGLATYRDLQDMRTILTDLAETAAVTGDAPTRRIASGMKSRLDDFLETNMPPEFADRFNAAKNLRIQQGLDFESGANIPLTRRGDTLEGQRIATSAIPGNYFGTGQEGYEAARAFQRSMAGRPEPARAMQDYVVSQALSGATDANGAINLNRLTNWTRARQPALRQMGMADMAALPAVRQDLARSQAAQNLAGVRGSPTAQNLSTQEIVNSIIGDTRISADTGAVESIGKSILTAVPRAATERLGQFFFGPANEAIRANLLDAMVDPNLAAQLMQNSRYMPRDSLTGILGELTRAYGVSQVPVTTGLLGRLLEEEDGKGRSGGGGARSSSSLPTGMIEPGNIDLDARPIVENSNGSYSTVLSRGFNIDGREVLLPTVSDDGHILTDDEAVEQYRRTGKHLGIFDTAADSNAYAESLHEAQDRQYAPRRNRKR
jgi:hypothetical protein